VYWFIERTVPERATNVVDHPVTRIDPGIAMSSEFGAGMY
jgi:hypothetical protein